MSEALANLKWHNARCVGTARLTEAFNELPPVTQLDALHDWLFDLTEEYNSRLLGMGVRLSPLPTSPKGETR